MLCPSTAIEGPLPLADAWIPKPPPFGGSGKSGTPWLRIHSDSFSPRFLCEVPSAAALFEPLEPPHAASVTPAVSIAVVTASLRSIAAVLRGRGLQHGNRPPKKMRR